MSKPKNRTYRCDICGATGVKLWREYNTLSDYTDLLCFTHTMEAVRNSRGFSGSTDLLGRPYTPERSMLWNRVAAVPDNFAVCMTEPIDSYWGYTSVPQDGVEWWNALPAESSDGKVSP